MPQNRKFTGFSPAHQPPAAKVSKKRQARAPELPPEAAISLPREMTEERRRALRARQLLSMDMENPPPIEADPLPDLDLDIQAPRGDQGNLIDGKTVFPVVRGPQPRENTRYLHGDPDLRQASSEEPASLIAAITLEDQKLLTFDNAMSDTHTSLRNLRSAAENLVVDLTSKGNIVALQNARDIKELITKVLEPWFMQIDDHLQQIVSNTTEAQEMGENLEDVLP